MYTYQIKTRQTRIMTNRYIIQTCLDTKEQTTVWEFTGENHIQKQDLLNSFIQSYRAEFRLSPTCTSEWLEIQKIMKNDPMYDYP